MEGGGVLEQIFAILLAKGIDGVIIVCLGYAVWKLYNRVQELTDTLIELGKESVRSNEAMTNALNTLDRSVRES